MCPCASQSACHPWSVPKESLVRSSSGTCVHLHHCQSGFVRFVHSMHSRQISRMSLRSRQMNRLSSPFQLLVTVAAGKFASLVLLLLPDAALSCARPLPQYPHFRQQRKESSVHACPFGFTVVFLALCLSLHSCPFLPLTLRAFHLPNIHRR